MPADRYIPVPPNMWRAFILTQRDAGLIDAWEAWRELWNGGLRGGELAKAMGWRPIR